MSTQTIQINIPQTHEMLAIGKRGKEVQLFEGAWYFDQDVVDMTHLRISDRTYTCPYKGVCYWLDLTLPDQEPIQNVGFMYFDTQNGYEFIQNKIGLYYGQREATYQAILA